MKRPAAIFLIFLLGCVISSALAQEHPIQSVREGREKMKSAVMIVAQENFRDEELLQPKQILERNGIEVKIASTTLKEIKGMLGARVKPDLLLSDVDFRKFDAVVFIGGAGASQYWDDPLAHELARLAQSNNRVLAAICIAPVTLAKAGVLKGRRATVWQSEGKQLQALGADYTAKPVEKDANIITAAGPFAAKEFGEEISRELLK